MEVELKSTEKEKEVELLQIDNEKLQMVLINSKECQTYVDYEGWDEL